VLNSKVCHAKNIQMISEAKATCRLQRMSPKEYNKSHGDRFRSPPLVSGHWSTLPRICYLGVILWRQSVAFPSKIVLMLFSVTDSEI
jgi:hypothetical protein